MKSLEVEIQEFQNWIKEFPKDALKLLSYFDTQEKGRPEIFHIFGGKLHSIVMDYGGNKRYNLHAQVVSGGVWGTLDLLKRKSTEFPNNRIIHIGDEPGTLGKLYDITGETITTGITTDYYGLIHVFPYVRVEDLNFG